MTTSHAVEIALPDVQLDGEWLIPSEPIAAIVLAHGAGAGFKHANMQAIAEHLAEQNIASMRFNFPYMQAGQRRTDRPEVACAAIQAAYGVAQEGLVHQNLNIPLLAGGHSFGGRMTSLATAQGMMDPAGLIFFSFPLHQPKKPDRKRAAHLPDISAPMLFLSGTRDDLAEHTLLTTVVDELPRARIHWLETGNHSYVILKRTRTNPMPIFEEIGLAARAFVDELI